MSKPTGPSTFPSGQGQTMAMPYPSPYYYPSGQAVPNLSDQSMAIPPNLGGPSGQGMLMPYPSGQVLMPYPSGQGIPMTYMPNYPPMKKNTTPEDKGLITVQTKDVEIKVSPNPNPIPMPTKVEIKKLETHKIKQVGQLHPKDMNPISQYRFYLINYQSLAPEGPLLKNIPTNFFVLKIYDLLMYCIQSVYYIVVFTAQMCCLNCCSLRFEDSVTWIYIKLFMGVLFFVLMVTVPGINIAFVIVDGLLFIYFLVFLFLIYCPNSSKVDIFKKAILVEKNHKLLAGGINEFLEITSEVKKK